MKAILTGYHVRIADDDGDRVCLLRLVGVPPDRDTKEIASWLVRLVNEVSIEPPLRKHVRSQQGARSS